MTMRKTRLQSRRTVSVGLIASIHRDAFLASPRRYLVAAYWWLRRKKVRARGQFAPLLAGSPYAYLIWRQQNAGRAMACGFYDAPTVIALIDIRNCGALADEAEETLAALSGEGIPALLIGTQGIASPAAAADLIDWEGEPWLMLLNAGDTVAPGTLMAYRAAINGSPGGDETRLFYADDDLLGDDGRHHTPYFKPDWNSELFRHHDYLTGACILHIEREDLENVEDGPGWARQLVKQVAERKADVQHVRHMLHHRRVRPRPSVSPVNPSSAAIWPSVSIIIPTRNRVDLLRTCIKGIETTDYPDIEVIIVDNDSDDPETLDFLAGLDSERYRVLRHPGVFNYSAINNHAAKEAKGQMLCLLNNDVEMTSPDWLAVMVAQAMRGEVGAVGARLLYPDGRIQHAGVVIGVGNAAGHAHRLLQPHEEGYFHRHSLPQFTMAVTAACLVVAREKFMTVGGLNEQDFTVAFNDVDLCLRLNQCGWQSLYEPRATLIHHESVSRGLDHDPVGAARFAGELAALQRLWATDTRTDSFHHPDLSRASEQFVIKL